MERIDNFKGYSKSNCKWASYSEQNKNKRSSSNTGIKHITFYSGVFIVHVSPFKYFRFKTLEDAIKCKNELLEIRKNNIKFREGTMIPDQITYTKRHNEGNYSHSEYSVLATLDEGDDVQECFLKLKSYVLNVIGGVTPEILVAEVNEYNTEIPPVIEEVKEVEVSTDSPSVSEKKTRSKKVKEEKVVVETPVASFIKYNRDIDAHKQILSGYLNSTHPTWKSVPTIKEFSASLVGTDFLDEDGVIIDSFKKTLNDFFSKN